MSRMIGMLRMGAMTLAFAALAGCGDNAPATDVAQVPVLTEAEANARTTVPLTRTVSLDKPMVIADLDFDLPPSGELAWSSLIIGIRIEAPDTKSIIALSDVIIQGGLPAKVGLQRIDGAAPVDMPLIRIGPDLKQRVPVAADGLTPGVRAAGLDGTMLAEAGLERDGALSDVLAFAHAAEPPPGRYHLRVELIEARPQLQGKAAQLIVGYKVRAK